MNGVKDALYEQKEERAQTSGNFKLCVDFLKRIKWLYQYYSRI